MKKADLQFLASTKQGRAVLWELLCFCAVDTAIDGDYQQMLLLEGKRRVGLQLKGHLVKHCEDEFFIMMKESLYKNEESDNEQKRNETRRNEEYDSGEDFNYGRHFGLDERDERDEDDARAGLFI